MNFYCDILIPTYNRKKFIKLIEHNINTQDYPFIENIIIADDGDDDEYLNINTKYNILYFKIDRCSIGAKRNFLISKSRSKYICMMDTDDLYKPEYISKSIFNLIYYNKDISGSSDMVIYDIANNKTYLQRCIYSHLLNEATLICLRDVFEYHKFKDASAGEANEIFINKIASIHHTDINNIMVCVAHSNNTVDKSMWFKDNYEVKTDELTKKILCDCNI